MTLTLHVDQRLSRRGLLVYERVLGLPTMFYGHHVVFRVQNVLGGQGGGGEWAAGRGSRAGGGGEKETVGGMHEL